MFPFRSLVALALLYSGVTAPVRAQTEVNRRSGGRLPDGSEPQIYTLKNKRLEVEIATYGGEVLSIKSPDRQGKMADVVLGFATLAGYYENNHSKNASFFGPIIGRYANRIAQATFTLEGKRYTLPNNDGENSLHSAPGGFNERLWAGRIIPGGVELSYVSKDGEGGFPGNLSVQVRYTLSKGDLKIDYTATTDAPTVLNLTNHSYFNLSGDPSGTILKEELKLMASRFTPVDRTLIPTGELRPLAGTPFDFQNGHPIGERIHADDEQLRFAHGYDHNFVIDRAGAGLTRAAEVYDPATGRVLEVWTTEPGVQFYTGNFLDGSIRGKGGRSYLQNAALCLETQHFPDSPNHPAFPSTVLRPGDTFRSTTVYRFSAR